MIHDKKCFSASHTGFISMYCQSVAVGLSALEQNLLTPSSQKYLTANAGIGVSTVPGWMSTVKAGNDCTGRSGAMFSLPTEYSNLCDVA